jgi:capsular polysaccharide transport system permease protein
MTDVRQVELTDVLTRTGRNEVGPTHGRDVQGLPPGPSPLATLVRRAGLRVRWRPLLMFLVCFSPALLTTIFYGLIASDRYVSTAAFIVRTASKPTGASGLNLFLHMAGLGRSEDDTYSVQNYMLSRDAVKELQVRLPLEEIYGRGGVDPISRYPSLIYGHTNEELFKFYTHMTSVVYNQTDGVTTLEVQAFRPEDAKAIATSLLDLGEQLVNRLNARIHADAVTTAEDQVKREEARLTHAQVAITAFQNKETMIDPTTNSIQVSQIVGKLQNDLAQTQARIADMTAASPNNPGLAALQRQADVTRGQIDRENARITSSQEGLADKLGQYQRMVLEREFATKALATASAALDSARAEIRRKQLYIERIIEPNQPDYATMPYRMWMIFTVCSINILALFVGWLLFAGVKEHVSSTH